MMDIMDHYRLIQMRDDQIQRIQELEQKLSNERMTLATIQKQIKHEDHLLTARAMQNAITE